MAQLMVLAGGMVVVLVLVAVALVPSPFEADREKLRVVKVGMTEEEVRRLLGEPYKIYEKATAPANYYVEGYARKERPITSKVFIYVPGEPIAYIYFDNSNKVEEVFVGGS